MQKSWCVTWQCASRIWRCVRDDVSVTMCQWSMCQWWWDNVPVGIRQCVSDVVSVMMWHCVSDDVWMCSTVISRCINRLIPLLSWSSSCQLPHFVFQWRHCRQSHFSLNKLGATAPVLFTVTLGLMLFMPVCISVLSKSHLLAIPTHTEWEQH